jgi:hypothetical protein
MFDVGVSFFHGLNGQVRVVNVEAAPEPSVFLRRICQKLEEMFCMIGTPRFSR